MPLALLAAVVLQSGVQVSTIRFMKWDDCVLVKNPTTRLVFVPEIGRIMHFSTLVGENLLWTNSTAKTGEGYVNWGGDKLWPAPQARWTWPPDPDLDGGAAWTVELLPTGFKATSPVSKKDGIRFARTVTLSPQVSAARIENEMEKVAGDPLELSIWQVCQVDNPETVTLQLNASPEMPEGFGRYDEKNRFREYVTVTDGAVIITRNPQAGMKFGAAGRNGLIAAEKNGVQFLMGSTYVEGAKYPDEGRAQQAFFSPDPLKYCELELTSPLKTYKVGEKDTHVVAWLIKNK